MDFMCEEHAALAQNNLKANYERIILKYPFELLLAFMFTCCGVTLDVIISY